MQIGVEFRLIILATVLFLIGCDGAPSEDAAPRQPADQVASVISDGDEHVLAVSWQPAFCETNERKPECASINEERFDATNFTLHGLWPQPRGYDYCGVLPQTMAVDQSGGWFSLEKLNLSEDVRRELNMVMPGTMSGLHRHEWIKHGTCYGGDEETYYRHSLHLIRQLNDSSVRILFQDSIGSSLSSKDIQGAFDSAFGAGAGDRVEVDCSTDKGRRMIVGLKIFLKGKIGEQTALKDLLKSGPRAHRGCDWGAIDPAPLS